MTAGMPTAVSPDRAVDTLAALYDQDYHAWCLRTAELLANGSLEALDVGHLREEVDSLAGRGEREVASRIKRIQQHLLKLQYQPGKRTRSWSTTLANQRDELASIFEQSPSLASFAQRNTAKVYKGARRLASIETGLPPGVFPDECPYTLDQILDQEFVPVG